MSGPRFRPPPIAFRALTLDWQRTYLVGVVNVTPDSFSDGGRYFAREAALTRARALVAAGADLIDVGGESTRPFGATPVTAAEEIERVVPVLSGLSDLPVVLSVDTTKAEVAAAALEAGAEVVNDISGGLFEPDIVEVAARAGAAFVCGHVTGRTLAETHDPARTPPDFDRVAADLADRLAALPGALRDRTMVDPGLGFGKGTAENLTLIRRAGELAAGLGRPVMLGPSRKRFLGDLTGKPVDDRDAATVGAALVGVAHGAHLVRVHAVELLQPALSVYEQIERLVAEQPPASRTSRGERA